MSTRPDNRPANAASTAQEKTMGTDTDITHTATSRLASHRAAARRAAALALIIGAWLAFGPAAALATSGPPAFGIQSFSFAAVDQNGDPYTQAGGHPYELTTSFTLNTSPSAAPGATVSTAGTLKDVKVSLPVGLVGNPTAVPRCSDYDLSRFQCSPDTEIGSMTISTVDGFAAADPLFNMIPPAGVPAEFGVRFNDFANAYITAGVRTGSDYGIDADSLKHHRL